MTINDILGASDSLAKLGDITMSGVVVIFALLFLLMFIGMFFAQNRNIRSLNRENKRALKDTIEIYENSHKDMQKRLTLIEHDKEEMDSYAKKIKESNEKLMKSNEELKKDRKLLHVEIQKLTDEVKRLREDYQKCLEAKVESIQSVALKQSRNRKG